MADEGQLQLADGERATIVDQQIEELQKKRSRLVDQHPRINE